jgi:hypothetical protein
VHTQAEREQSKAACDTHTHTGSSTRFSLGSSVRLESRVLGGVKRSGTTHPTRDTSHSGQTYIMGFVAVNLAAVLGGLALSAPAADWPPAPGSGGAK